MGKRKRIGLVYIWDETWLGGKYYLQNLMIALNMLDDNKKPLINLYCLSENSFRDFQENTKYPYLEKTIVKIRILHKVYSKLLSFFSKEASLRINFFPLNEADDWVFPVNIGSDSNKMISWIADFQEKHFPQYFTKSDIAYRDILVRSTCRRGIPIVFSSYDSQNDFKYFYNELENHPTFVVHFAVNQPDFSALKIDNVLHKYDIKKSYLICPNQFWQHKNHLFLFKAFKKCLEKGLDLQLVCTGRMEDYRCPEYIKKIKAFLEDYHLENDILTLGVIDKLELLCLMRYSYAVIQPSLFEGWNTTVEDSKAMNKFIFLSDLNVHREQISKNVCFFDPHDENDLVQKLLTVSPTEEFFDYSNCVRQFGEDFYRVIETTTSRE